MKFPACSSRAGRDHLRTHSFYIKKGRAESALKICVPKISGRGPAPPVGAGCNGSARATNANNVCVLCLPTVFPRPLLSGTPCYKTDWPILVFLRNISVPLVIQQRSFPFGLAGVGANRSGPRKYTGNVGNEYTQCSTITGHSWVFNGARRGPNEQPLAVRGWAAAGLAGPPPSMAQRAPQRASGPYTLAQH